MGTKTTSVYYARAHTCITGRKRGGDAVQGGEADVGAIRPGVPLSKGRDPKGAPGTVVREILPQGPRALGERQRAE